MKKENIKLLALFLFIGGIIYIMGKTAFSQSAGGDIKEEKKTSGTKSDAQADKQYNKKNTPTSIPEKTQPDRSRKQEIATLSKQPGAGRQNNKKNIPVHVPEKSQPDTRQSHDRTTPAATSSAASQKPLKPLEQPKSSSGPRREQVAETGTRSAVDTSMFALNFWKALYNRTRKIDISFEGGINSEMNLVLAEDFSIEASGNRIFLFQKNRAEKLYLMEFVNQGGSLQIKILDQLPKDRMRIIKKFKIGQSEYDIDKPVIADPGQARMFKTDFPKSYFFEIENDASNKMIINQVKHMNGMVCAYFPGINRQYKLPDKEKEKKILLEIPFLRESRQFIQLIEQQKKFLLRYEQCNLRVIKVNKVTLK